MILSLDWIDLKGEFDQAIGKGQPVNAKVIHCSLDRYLHNGWSMDHYGVPPVDLPILSTPDMLVRPLTAAIRRLRGTDAPAAPKFPLRQAPQLPAPRATGMMGLRDLGLVIRRFVEGRTVTIANYSLGWPSDTVSFNHPLDYVGFDSGGGVGSGPGMSIGTALALKDSGRLVLSIIGDGDFAMACNAFWTAAHMEHPAAGRCRQQPLLLQRRRASGADGGGPRPAGREQVHRAGDGSTRRSTSPPSPARRASAPRARSRPRASLPPRSNAARRRCGPASAYLIDARIHVGYADEKRGEHTAGRKA